MFWLFCFGQPWCYGAAMKEAEERVALDENVRIESFRHDACDG